ncbi:MAG: diguanylate cyclase [Candidatus Manganitrophus sp.]|nr:MAG: diguanylate cyclase [Candidatus Manganitrophus sp.]
MFFTASLEKARTLAVRKTAPGRGRLAAGAGRAGKSSGGGALAEKIVAAVARPVALDGKEVVTSTSIGISLYPGDANNPEDLTIAADAALYRAKERGRHTYEFYTAELTTRALERLSLENSSPMPSARLRGIGALLPASDDLVAGRIGGVEALIRWHHPQEGMILPRGHCGGRGERADRIDRRLGAAAGVRAGRRLAGQGGALQSICPVDKFSTTV